MHGLVELLGQLLFELLTWLPPGSWQSHESRSVVGESDLDRKMRRFWIGVFFALLAIGMGVFLWLHFRR